MHQYVQTHRRAANGNRLQSTTDQLPRSGLRWLLVRLLAAVGRLPLVDLLQGVADHSREEDEATGQVERGLVAPCRVHEDS